MPAAQPEAPCHHGLVALHLPGVPGCWLQAAGASPKWDARGIGAGLGGSRGAADIPGGVPIHRLRAGGGWGRTGEVTLSLGCPCALSLPLSIPVPVELKMLSGVRGARRGFPTAGSSLQPEPELLPCARRPPKCPGLGAGSRGTPGSFLGRRRGAVTQSSGVGCEQEPSACCGCCRARCLCCQVPGAQLLGGKGGPRTLP